MVNIKNKFNWRRRLCSYTTREKKKNETTMNVFCIPYTNSAFCSWIYMTQCKTRTQKIADEILSEMDHVPFLFYFVCIWFFLFFFYSSYFIWTFMTIHICNIYSAFSSGKYCRLLYLSTCEYRHNGISLLHFYTKNKRIFLEKKKK